jgi:hypothetical protein
LSINREWLASIVADDPAGLLDTPAKPTAITRDERLIARFQEICDFIEARGRSPEGNAADPQEFSLHARLKAILADPDQCALLRDFDTVGALVEPEPPETLEEVVGDDPAGLLDEGADLFELRNVPVLISQPDHVASRQECSDFEDFRSLFEQCHADIRAGRRKIIPFRGETQISVGAFFVYGGLLAYVESMGDASRERGKKVVARLRCILENGTEFDPLLRSFGRQLYKHGRRVTEPSEDTLNRMGLEPGTKMGFVYVLRSLSTDSQVAAIPDLHKIGFTTRTTAARIQQANAEKTYLRAPVALAAEYSLPASLASGIEATLHQFFAGAKIQVTYEHGGVVLSEANEWFSVPLSAIDEAIDLINVEALSEHEYDPVSRTIRLKAT